MRLSEYKSLLSVLVYYEYSNLHFTHHPNRCGVGVVFKTLMCRNELELFPSTSALVVFGNVLIRWIRWMVACQACCRGVSAGFKKDESGGARRGESISECGRGPRRLESAALSQSVHNPAESAGAVLHLILQSSEPAVKVSTFTQMLKNAVHLGRHPLESLRVAAFLDLALSGQKVLLLDGLPRGKSVRCFPS